MFGVLHPVRDTFRDLGADVGHGQEVVGVCCCQQIHAGKSLREFFCHRFADVADAECKQYALKGDAAAGVEAS